MRYTQTLFNFLVENSSTIIMHINQALLQVLRSCNALK